MKRIFVTALVIPPTLAVAIFAGYAASSSADSYTCGSDVSSGSGGSGSGGSGSGGSGSGAAGSGVSVSGCCGTDVSDGSGISVSGDSGFGGGSGSSGGSGFSDGFGTCAPPPSDRLYGVAGTSASDVWAVGLESHSSLIMHWNGSTWRTAFTEPVGYFAAAAAISPRDAWAVGGTGWFSPSYPLAEHWDGTSWTKIPVRAPGSSAIFNGVAATSATNVWAVGLIGPGPGTPSPTGPLIERWNGSVWKRQSVPEPADGGQFAAVAATSGRDAWAVGWTGESSEGTGQTTLIDHWDGSTWTPVASPDPAGSANFLDGVAAIAPDDAWAVGFTISASGEAKSLTMHWDGSSWTVVSSPDPTGDTLLRGVAAASADNVWAVGYTNPSQCGHGPKCGTAILHWDGTSWTTMRSPNPTSNYLNAFLGVTAIAGDDAWAVGTTDYVSVLTSHWDGRAWN